MSFCSLLSVSETFHLLFFLCSRGFSLDGARAQIFEKQKTVFCNRYCCVVSVAPLLKMNERLMKLP